MLNALMALPIWRAKLVWGREGGCDGKRKLICKTPATISGASPAYRISSELIAPGAVRPYCRIDMGRTGAPRTPVRIVPSGCGKVEMPPPVAHTVTMEPGAAGLAAVFREPSWLRATENTPGSEGRTNMVGPARVPDGVMTVMVVVSCPNTSAGTMVLICVGPA